MGSAGDRGTVARFVDSQGSPFGQQWEVLVTVMRSHDFAGEMLQFSAWTWEATVVMTDPFSLAAIKQQDEGKFLSALSRLQK